MSCSCQECQCVERWIPVGERLPEMFCDVLVPWDGTLLVAYHDGDVAGGPGWYERYSEREIVVTHWRPLPAPPEVSP